MAERKEKTKPKPADATPLFDSSFLASALVVMALLVIAIIVSWLPQLFMTPRTIPTQSGQQTLSPDFSNQTTVPVPMPQCKELLSNGSERYDFMYAIKADSENTGTMESHLYSVQNLTNAAWMRETEYTFDFSKLIASMNLSGSSSVEVPSSVKFVTYLDEEFRCIEVYTTMKISGQEIKQPLSCGETNDNFVVCKDNLTVISRTTLTVAAGTFNVTNYLTNENSTISMADIPLPIETFSGESRMQLMSYRKVV